MNISKVTFYICNSTLDDLIPGVEYIKMNHEHVVKLIEISNSLNSLCKILAIHHIHPVSEISEKLIIIHGELQNLVRNILQIKRFFKNCNVE